MPQQHHSLGYSQFSNGVGRITGNESHGEAQLFGIFLIDMIRAGSTGQDVFYAQFFVNVQVLFVGEAVATQNDCIKPFGHFSGFFRIQIIRNAFDVIAKFFVAGFKNRQFNISYTIT